MGHRYRLRQPETLQDVKTWFDALASTEPADWQTVQDGADYFHDVDVRYEGIADTTSLADAQALLGVDSNSEVDELVLKSHLGTSVSDVTYTGDDEAGFLINDFEIPGVLSANGGILLSTGGFPGRSNTSNSKTVAHDTPGDPDLDVTVGPAFDSAGTTNDAAVITFENAGTVADGMSFHIVFGSDECPEYLDSSYVDIAAIYVKGVDVALFNDNPKTPLSVVDDNLPTGNFIDNSSSNYAIDWDGFSNWLAVRAPHLSGGGQQARLLPRAGRG